MTPEILYGIGAVILLAALIWGTVQYRRRSAAQKAIGEAATRRLYDDAATKEQRAEREQS
jgi:hypothetical protein